MSDLFGSADRVFTVELAIDHYTRATKGDIRRSPVVLALEDVIGHYPEMFSLGDLLLRPAVQWWTPLPAEVFAATKAWHLGERAKPLKFELAVPARAIFGPSADVIWGKNWRMAGARGR